MFLALWDGPGGLERVTNVEAYTSCSNTTFASGPFLALGSAFELGSVVSVIGGRGHVAERISNSP